jgi:putative FmdB family regulatory protein
MLWDYLCPDCGTTSEHFDDDGKKRCPNCGKHKLKKILSAPNIKTSYKSAPDKRSAGLLYEIEADEVTTSTPFALGEMINIPDGHQVIVSPRAPLNPKKLKRLAVAMRKPRRPDPSKLH